MCGSLCIHRIPVVPTALPKLVCCVECVSLLKGTQVRCCRANLTASRGSGRRKAKCQCRGILREVGISTEQLSLPWTHTRSEEQGILAAFTAAVAVGQACADISVGAANPP